MRSVSDATIPELQFGNNNALYFYRTGVLRSLRRSYGTPQDDKGKEMVGNDCKEKEVSFFTVIPQLDWGIHSNMANYTVDCRVKPDNDKGKKKAGMTREKKAPTRHTPA